MASKNIPGNWRAFESASYPGEWGVETDDEKLVGMGEEIVLYPNHSKELANLIAAAPDLLDALIHAAQDLESLGFKADAARTAIAKAEGRS